MITQIIYYLGLDESYVCSLYKFEPSKVLFFVDTHIRFQDMHQSEKGYNVRVNQ